MSQVLKKSEQQLTAATKNDLGRSQLCLGPFFNWMGLAFFMALVAGIETAAALEFDGNHIKHQVVMHAPGLIVNDGPQH